jgi:alpha-L-arabinofuranosidase
MPSYKNVPFLDASLTVDGSKASLFLINRHPKEDMNVEIEIEGVNPGSDALSEVISGPSFSSENQIGFPELVASTVEEIKWPERIKLPPCSISTIATT